MMVSKHVTFMRHLKVPLIPLPKPEKRWNDRNQYRRSGQSFTQAANKHVNVLPKQLLERIMAVVLLPCPFQFGRGGQGPVGATLQCSGSWDWTKGCIDGAGQLFSELPKSFQKLLLIVRIDKQSPLEKDFSWPAQQSLQTLSPDRWGKSTHLHDGKPSDFVVTWGRARWGPAG